VVNKPEKVSQVEDSLPRMRAELKDLLDRSPGARDVLQPLATLERALKSLGIGAFEGLPSHVLKRAATQLESVLPEPIGQGIAELRTRIAKGLLAHEKVPVPVVAPAQPPTYFSDDKLQVSETTVTDFMRVVEASQRKF
jgi:hypothetical protein